MPPTRCHTGTRLREPLPHRCWRFSCPSSSCSQRRHPLRTCRTCRHQHLPLRVAVYSRHRGPPPTAESQRRLSLSALSQAPCSPGANTDARRSPDADLHARVSTLGSLAAAWLRCCWAPRCGAEVWDAVYDLLHKLCGRICREDF